VQERSQANLRTYALKASEKVNNLSSELNKLAVYLEDELNYTEYNSSGDGNDDRYFDRYHQHGGKSRQGL